MFSVLVCNLCRSFLERHSRMTFLGLALTSISEYEMFQPESSWYRSRLDFKVSVLIGTDTLCALWKDLCNLICWIFASCHSVTSHISLIVACVLESFEALQELHWSLNVGVHHCHHQVPCRCSDSPLIWICNTFHELLLRFSVMPSCQSVHYIFSSHSSASFPICLSCCYKFFRSSFKSSFSHKFWLPFFLKFLMKFYFSHSLL